MTERVRPNRPRAIGRSHAHARQRRRQPQHLLAEAHDDGGRRHHPPRDSQPAARERHRDVAAGEGAGVAPPPVPGEARAPVLLGVRRRAVQAHGQPADARLPLDPGGQDHRMPILAQSRHGLRRAKRTEDRPRPEYGGSSPQVDPGVIPEAGVNALCRAVQGSRSPDAEALAPTGRRSDDRVTHEAAGVGSDRHRGPRTLRPLADPAEKNDHRAPRRVDDPPVIALHRAAMSPPRIAKRQIRPGAAIGVEEAAQHHPYLARLARSGAGPSTEMPLVEVECCHGTSRVSRARRRMR